MDYMTRAPEGLQNQVLKANTDWIEDGMRKDGFFLGFDGRMADEAALVVSLDTLA